ncbi:MAG TPA: hypothetical protein VHD90_20985, partial [Phototrophicaceae bacterium]|nr:hypothetical protein [Phototrophicaceae bacterium]
MKSTRLITLILLLLVAVTWSVAQAQTLTPTPGAPAPTAQNTLLAYYTDINRHNYQAAYNLWHDPSQSYDIFVSGYSDTDHVTAYFGDLQSHNIAGQLGRVPTVLLGYDDYGNVASFYGCFTLSFNYHITGATIHQLSTNGVPDQASITNLMSIDCTHIPTSEPSTTFLDTSDPSYGLMWSYFRAINQKDFTTAYADWLAPIPGPKPNGQPAEDYRQT